jgi:hypothetical protein
MKKNKVIKLTPLESDTIWWELYNVEWYPGFSKEYSAIQRVLKKLRPENNE